MKVIYKYKCVPIEVGSLVNGQGHAVCRLMTKSINHSRKKKGGQLEHARNRTWLTSGEASKTKSTSHERNLFFGFYDFGEAGRRKCNLYILMCFSLFKGGDSRKRKKKGKHR
jgi:hypothetical protein